MNEWTDWWVLTSTQAFTRGEWAHSLLCRGFSSGDFCFWGAQALDTQAAAVAVCGRSSWAHGLSCSVAYGISLDQGLNWCPLHFKADS